MGAVTTRTVPILRRQKMTEIQERKDKFREVVEDAYNEDSFDDEVASMMETAVEQEITYDLDFVELGTIIVASQLSTELMRNSLPLTTGIGKAVIKEVGEIQPEAEITLLGMEWSAILVLLQVAQYAEDGLFAGLLSVVGGEIRDEMPDNVVTLSRRLCPPEEMILMDILEDIDDLLDLG